MRIILSAAALASTVAVAPAMALPVSADLFQSLDVPAAGVGPRVFEAPGAVFGPGPELDFSNEVANPSDWEGFLEVNFTADGLSFTLTHREQFTDYEVFSLVFSDFQFSAPGERIVGVSRVTDSIVEAIVSDPFNEVLGFNATSITLDIATLAPGDLFNFFEGGSATYAITTEVINGGGNGNGGGGGETVIPAPAALPLLALGLAGLGMARLRRRRG